MSHVQITHAGVGTSIVIDGRDVSRSILRDGFSVQPHEDGTWTVNLCVRADILEIDLPEALLAATVASEPERDAD
jgi:hypothetical protein